MASNDVRGLEPPNSMELLVIGRCVITLGGGPDCWKAILPHAFRGPANHSGTNCGLLETLLAAGARPRILFDPWWPLGSDLFG